MRRLKWEFQWTHVAVRMLNIARFPWNSRCIYWGFSDKRAFQGSFCTQRSSNPNLLKLPTIFFDSSFNIVCVALTQTSLYYAFCDRVGFLVIEYIFRLPNKSRTFYWSWRGLLLFNNSKPVLFGKCMSEKLENSTIGKTENQCP